MGGFEDRLDVETKTWKPRDVQSGSPNPLIGTFAGLAMRTGSEFAAYPVLSVVDDHGDEWDVHAFHDVLRNELARQRPRYGERIGIKYLGKAKGERAYENYRVIVDRPEPARTEVDWSAVAVGETGEKPRSSLDAPSPFPSDDGTDAWDSEPGDDEPSF